MASEASSPKHEPTPVAPVSSIPLKRAFEEDHSPAISSPLNPDVNTHAPDDTPNVARARSGRQKKETFKKREAKGTDSRNVTPDPKATKVVREKEPEETDARPLRYIFPTPKAADFEAPRGPVLVHHHDVTGSDGQSVEFFESTEHVSNKRIFRYTHCIADPMFSTTIYRGTEPEPYGPRMSHEDAASHIFFDKASRIVTTDKGYRMARANVAVREGRWYWECKITQGIRKPEVEGESPTSGHHVRMGWARREASLDAPVGFDAYSYGIRDVSGEKVFMSRPKDFFPPGEDIHDGDVIGLEIQLPSERLHRKVLDGTLNPVVDVAEEGASSNSAEAANIVRDRVPIRFKAHTYFEKIEYHSAKELEDLMNPSPMGPASTVAAPNPHHAVPALRTLPKSYIKIYKNGVCMGTAFEDLLTFLPPASKPLMSQHGARDGLDDGMLGYYPAISVFRGGAAEVNFGPDFWYPPKDFKTSASTDEDVDMTAPDAPRLEKLRAVSERYYDQIAEDIVYDIIDEVDLWMLDGGGATDASSSQEKRTEVAMGQSREEIKEIVQDD